MQINNNLFARQTPLMMGNKIGGAKPNNVVAKAINNVQNMLPQQEDTTSADHIRKIYALNNLQNNDTVEETDETEETTKTSLDLEQVDITKETSKRYEENVYNVYEQATSSSNEMQTMYECLTIAEKYEEYANTDGISDEAREQALAVVDNIKNYVATVLTTGDDIYQHMHKNDDTVYSSFEEFVTSGAIDEYKSQGGNAEVIADKSQATSDAISLTQDLLSSVGVNVSSQDIFLKTNDSLSANDGIPKDREEFDSISTADMKEMLLNAKDYYDNVANKVKDLYIAEFDPNNEKSELFESNYNPTSNDIANALATDLMTFGGATFEGQMKNNLQSIDLVLCTGENNSQQTVITKLVEIENVDVKLEDVGEDMRDYILQSQKDTEIAKEVLGDYYVN